MSRGRKAKYCGVGLETKVMNCCISAYRSPEVVSSPIMCILKAIILQNESEARNLRGSQTSLVLLQRGVGFYNVVCECM